MHPQVAKLIELDAAGPAQRTEEWYKLRDNHLTASAAATALGVNKYEKPESLILTKCGYNEFKGNAITEWGNIHEDEARKLYEEMYDEKVHELGILPHPEINFLAGSPDGVTESGRLVEIKCPARRKITNEVPEHYMPQIQLLLEIMDLEVCDFIQYRPVDGEFGSWPNPYEFNVVTVVREREWFTENLPIMRNFWDRVMWHREHGCQELLEAREKRKKGPRKKKVQEEKPPEENVVCEI